MKFLVIHRGDKIPNKGRNKIYLRVDKWNDYSYVTMFYLSLHDDEGNYHELGNIKIGFEGQSDSVATYETLGQSFNALPENYFSLGMELEYYRGFSEFSEDFRIMLLALLQDVVFDNTSLDRAMNEDVFSVSLLRDVSLSVLKGQFRRVLSGGVPLTDFKFSYRYKGGNNATSVKLRFDVEVESTPSTNIHAIIGRNGVGKTTLLNDMIFTITEKDNKKGEFLSEELYGRYPISDDYFSSLVSVSFSAFDPFSPPREQSDPSKGTCYFYIGLKNYSTEDSESLKKLSDIHSEFIRSLSFCFSQPGKKQRWIESIEILESDENFAEMQLRNFEQYSGDILEKKAKEQIEHMSSGHAVVLLTVTKLVATVEEKTLILIDEPESHLHPPLLSAFIRALSQLLYRMNGVAIIATHSPVVLQEVPQSCVWKITRSGVAMNCTRPECETFGENVGVLTREVFGLEVVKSGFHQLLLQAVDEGGTYEAIISKYNGQLGFEARAILKALVLHRDGTNNSEKA